MGALLLHFYPMLIERGFSEYAAVAAMGLIGPAQVAGRILTMSLGKAASGRRIGSIVAVGFPAAMAMFVWAPPEFLIIGAAAVLYGAANGPHTWSRQEKSDWRFRRRQPVFTADALRPHTESPITTMPTYWPHSC